MDPSSLSSTSLGKTSSATSQFFTSPSLSKAVNAPSCEITPEQNQRALKVLTHPLTETSALFSSGHRFVDNAQDKGSVKMSPCLKSLGKVEKFFLKIAAKIFPSVKVYLDGRKTEHGQLVKINMAQKMIRSVNAAEAHRSLPKTNEGRQELMELDSELFLEEEELKSGPKSNKKVAELAVERKMHKGVKEGGHVAEIEVDGFGTMEAYSFGNHGPVRHQGVIPTSFMLGDEKGHNEDHLTNAYVIHIGDQQAVIRTGKIDSKQRADDFVALINVIHEKYAVDKPGVVLRVVSQQLNSFEDESKIIDGQHRWIADVNQRLQGKAEVIHINVPSNRWYHSTRSLERLGLGSLVRKIAKHLFQGERLSKEQNIDSWGTYSKWAAADVAKVLSTLPADHEINQNQDLGEALSMLTANQEVIQDIKADIDVLIGSIEDIKGRLRNETLDKETKADLKTQLKELNSRLSGDRAILKDLLIQDQLAYGKIETALASIQNPSPEITKALQTASLMRQVLGSQLGLEGEVISRGKEGMAIQLLNERLGITAALNCKSGLDRTGLWHAVKLAMLSVGKNIGAERSFALTNEWDQTTSLMNKISARLGQKDHIGDWLDKGLGEWKAQFGDLIPADMTEEQFGKLKEKIGDVVDLRKAVLKNLIKIGIPITTASTGMMGLKWNSGFQENLIPLNFLPTHVKKGDKQVPLVKHEKSGTISGISTIGRTLITKFQKLRGS